MKTDKSPDKTVELSESEREIELVIAALLKAPRERTGRERRIVAYSRYGTAPGCGCDC